MAAADLVVDAADSFAVTYMLSDACFAAAKPLISASVIGLTGVCRRFLGGGGPSYRAVFPRRVDRWWDLRHGRRLGQRGRLDGRSAGPSRRCICSSASSHRCSVVSSPSMPSDWRSVRLRLRRQPRTGSDRALHRARSRTGRRYRRRPAWPRRSTGFALCRRATFWWSIRSSSWKNRVAASCWPAAVDNVP